MSQEPNKKCVAPTKNDVKCGRGASNFKHPGNQYLRSLIAPQVELYSTCTVRTQKTAIIRDIIGGIYRMGGKFIKYDHPSLKWYDGGLEAAKIRVGVAFRDAVARRKRGTNGTKRIKADSIKSDGNDRAHDQYEQMVRRSQDAECCRPSPPPMSSAITSEILSSATNNRSLQQLLASLPRTQQPHAQKPSNSVWSCTRACDVFEPHAIDSNDEDLGLVIAQSVLDALSNSEDTFSSCSSLSSQTVESSARVSIDDSKLVTKHSFYTRLSKSRKEQQAINETLRQVVDDEEVADDESNALCSLSSAIAEEDDLELCLFGDSMLSEIDSLEDDHSLFTFESLEADGIVSSSD